MGEEKTNEKKTINMKMRVNKENRRKEGRKIKKQM